MDIETFVSLAEIEYHNNNFKIAISHATKALKYANPTQQSALKIFIARAHAKLGDTDTSNKLYRELLRSQTYMPPVIMGLLYNTWGDPQKSKNNLHLIKIFAGSSND